MPSKPSRSRRRRARPSRPAERAHNSHCDSRVAHRCPADSRATRDDPARLSTAHNRCLKSWVTKERGGLSPAFSSCLPSSRVNIAAPDASRRCPRTLLLQRRTLARAVFGPSESKRISPLMTGASTAASSTTPNTTDEVSSLPILMTTCQRIAKTAIQKQTFRRRVTIRSEPPKPSAKTKKAPNNISDINSPKTKETICSSECVRTQS